MKVVINGTEYIPADYRKGYVGKLNDGTEVCRGDILWDSRKEHWNIAVDHIEVRWLTRYFIGQDGRALNASRATTMRPAAGEPQGKGDSNV